MIVTIWIQIQDMNLCDDIYDMNLRSEFCDDSYDMDSDSRYAFMCGRFVCCSVVSVLQCVAVCCSVLQCVAVCRSVL